MRRELLIENSYTSLMIFADIDAGHGTIQYACLGWGSRLLDRVGLAIACFDIVLPLATLQSS